ncbi:MAG: magnesium transporter [Planctomycetes bacterium]|jgi:magnesium transporter|nr:magnesium transporter [Planctomycetota bacterium]MCL4728939.1 magnesium transporter [Planctomycetota bacterium]
MTLARLIGPEIAEMLRGGDVTGFRALSEEFHPADVAEIIESAPEDKRLVAFLAVDRKKQPEVFEYLEPETQARLLNDFKPDVLSRMLAEISADTRTELLQELPGPVARKLLEVLPAEERKATLALLQYPPDSAGRTMTPEFLHVPADATAADVLAKVRRFADQVETVYVIYVIDAGHRLIGTLSLRDVVVAEPSAQVRTFMRENVAFVKTTDHREEVLRKLREYDVVAIPVVDSEQRLVGIVTFDDLSDVAEEEATEDILKMHGVATQNDDYFSASLGRKFRARVIWLVALVVVSSASVLVQQAYNPVIAHLSLLAAYITMITASSGNVGTQSAGILIRAISTDGMDRKRLRAIFLRELAVGAMLSLTMAGLAVTLVLVRGAHPQTLGGHEVHEVAVIVGLAMALALATSNALGAAIPLVTRALKIDPAVTAGPFITTAADILTVLIYFNIAEWLILR